MSCVPYFIFYSKTCSTLKYSFIYNVVGLYNRLSNSFNTLSIAQQKKNRQAIVTIKKRIDIRRYNDTISEL